MSDYILEVRRTPSYFEMFRHLVLLFHASHALALVFLCTLAHTLQEIYEAFTNDILPRVKPQKTLNRQKCAWRGMLVESVPLKRKLSISKNFVDRFLPLFYPLADIILNLLLIFGSKSGQSQSSA